MKNHLIIPLLFLSIGVSQQEYNNNELIQLDNGLWTEKFSDKPITGKVYGYFGEVKPYKKVYMGNLLNGKKEGRWKNYYHSTGKKSEDFNFKNGKEVGLFTEWYENGQKKWEWTYKDGKQDGVETYWFDNGQKKWDTTFKDGELVKLIGMWNEDGSVKK